MQIIAKMTRDYIPKTIMYHIVQNVCEFKRKLLIEIEECFVIFQLQKFVAKELLAHLYALPDPVRDLFLFFRFSDRKMKMIQKALLQESEEEKQRRQIKLAEYAAIKDVRQVECVLLVKFKSNE